MVQQDSAPAFYIYQQSFRLGERTYSRIGFFCEVSLEKPGTGSILRHELTLPKPKKDRLELLRHTQLNTSPIFGIFSDRRKIVTTFLASICKKKPYIKFVDGEQIRHKFWICKDLTVIKKIQVVLKQTEIMIADGHHRYETAWEYFQESNQPSASSVLFFLCPMQSSGLVIFPTHRVLTKNWNLDKLLQRLKSQEPILAYSVPQSLKAHPRALNASFSATDGRKIISVTIGSSKELKKKFPQYSAAYLKLPIFHLHGILFPELKKEDFIYTHDEKDAVEMARKKNTLAFLVPPVTVQELFSVVKQKALMPQKSTYFYPKIPTGLLFRSLE